MFDVLGGHWSKWWFGINDEMISIEKGQVDSTHFVRRNETFVAEVIDITLNSPMEIEAVLMKRRRCDRRNNKERTNERWLTR